jgi:manganese/zinc/iron transport system substrate-binding protein
MKKRVFGALMVVAVFFIGCGGDAPASSEPNAVNVVATTTIVGDLIRTIGGPHVYVEVLMGPGIDPHLFKASAGDVRRMSSADAIFYNGLHLEGKMSEVLEKMGERDVVTVAVAECLPGDELISLQGYSGLHDPHVWFDVKLWAGTIGCAADALAALDPPHADAYRDRADAYAKELADLDAWVRVRADELATEDRLLVTAHDAFAYFARAYGFEVRGLLGVSTAAEAGTSDVQELASFIVERRIPAVFVETSVSPRYVEALQEAVAARGFSVEIGGTLFSDSLGDAGKPEGSYAGTVRANVMTIIAALQR